MEGVDGMTDKPTKLEPPLYLDLDFGKALARFIQTKPKEVQESVERAKQKKSPGENAARRRPESDEHDT